MVSLALSALGVVGVQQPASAEIFVCPGPGGQAQLQFKPGPDCKPLADPERETKKEAGLVKPEREITFSNLETEGAAFLKRYRDLMACCASNLDYYQDVSDLEGQASDILRQAEALVGGRFSLLSATGGLIIPVAQARERLREVKRRMEQIAASQERLESLDYEAAARERRRIQEAEQSIERELTPKPQPGRAPTGTEIGKQDRTGAGIGSSAPTGTEIGKTPATGPEIGTTPPTLPTIIGTPPGERGDSLTTTKPASTGTVGPAIGTVPPTGPAIGDSSSNK